MDLGMGNKKKLNNLVRGGFISAIGLNITSRRQTGAQSGKPVLI